MGNQLSSADSKSSHSSATNLSTAHERFTTPKLTDSLELVRKTPRRQTKIMKRDSETFDCIKNGDKLKVIEFPFVVRMFILLLLTHFFFLTSFVNQLNYISFLDARTY